MKMKRWLAIPLTLGLMITSLAMVSASEGHGDEPQGFSGTVSTYDEASGVLVLAIRNAGQPEPTLITIEVASEVIKIPGESSETGVAGTFTEGAKVAVLAHQVEGEDQWIADSLVVKPIKPAAPPVVGAVVSKTTDADGNTVLTITNKDGVLKEILLPDGVDAPAEGELVAAFARADNKEKGRPVLTGLVKADEVRQRLIGHLDEVASKVDLPEAARARLTEDLATTLGSFVDKHVSILEGIRAKAPAAAQLGLDKALGKAQEARATAKDKAADAREKAGPPEGRGRQSK